MVILSTIISTLYLSKYTYTSVLPPPLLMTQASLSYWGVKNNILLYPSAFIIYTYRTNNILAAYDKIYQVANTI